MEKELNIAAILKGKPTETKLWSPMLGDCIYCYNNTYPEEIIIAFTDKNGEEKEWTFSYSGRTISAPDTAEVCLFPSKYMQDWSKFAWKKGDVLVSNDNDSHIIFEGFSKDDYTTFKGKHLAGVSIKRYIYHLYAQNTQGYHIEDDKDAAQTYINTIEERFCGKLNLETLEIEKQPKQEFKDGDILYSNLVGNEVFIAKIEEKGILHSYVYMDIYNKVLNIDKDETFSMSGCIYNGNIRLATDSEKQQLFSALEKEGKRWNPVTKQIEDLPKKYELKPFDKVLAKIAGHTWTADFFSHYDENDEELPYVCIGYGRVIHCIPYNEETKHLLGTTDEWKG
jgi:hypothetical protein